MKASWNRTRKVVVAAAVGVPALLGTGFMLGVPAANAAYGPVPNTEPPQQAPATSSIAASHSSLAFTGTDAAATIGAGAAALGLGGALVLVSRRRRNGTAGS